MSVLPQGKFAQCANGYRMHYLDVGKGPVVVFLHGSGPGDSGYSNFKGNYPYLVERGFRCIVPDHIGYGFSDKPESVSATFGPGGGTLTTDTEGDGATPADPIETEVASPLAGTVSIAEPDRAPPAPPTAWSFLGQLAQISAPVATVADPLRLLFLLDASVAVPVGGAAAIAVFRNGVEVGPCTGAPQTVPDPCVE